MVENSAYTRGAAALARRWWGLVLRGVVAVLFGLLTFFAPGVSLVFLVVLFGAYAVVNGSINLMLFLRRTAGEERWRSLLFESIASIVGGVITLVWPGITALILLWVIAAWAVATGIGQVVAAVRLRKQIRGEWLLGLSGALSFVFGVLMIFFPRAGALAVALWIGAYAVAFGVLLIGLGLRLRSWGRTTSHVVPPGAVPASR